MAEMYSFINAHYYEHMHLPQPLLGFLHIPNPANYVTLDFQVYIAKMRI